MKQTDNQHTFLDRRQQFEKKYFEGIKDSSILKSISVVDVSTTDLCNRTCVFCPRHDPKVYPNRNLHMSVEGAEIISKKLKGIGYTGTIAISGFGENLLNPNITDIVRVFKSHNPDAFVECNTNGDPLKAGTAQALIDAGLDCLNVNLYDGPEQVEVFDKLLASLPSDKFKYRSHWNPADHGIIFNNRSGLIRWVDDPKAKEVKSNSCYYPFYKLFVDWNGDVLFCANDWGRVRVIGNLLQQSIEDVWMSKEMTKVRKRLAKGNRGFKPCNTCSVNGTLIGRQSFDMLMGYYENSSNRVK